MQGKDIINTPWTISAGTDVGGSILKTAADVAGPVDVRDLDQLSIFLACVNAGSGSPTFTALIQSSIDGTNWVTEATITQASLSALNAAVRTTLSDSHGMSIPVKFVQCTLSAVAGGMQFQVGHIGIQRKTWS